MRSPSNEGAILSTTALREVGHCVDMALRHLFPGRLCIAGYLKLDTNRCCQSVLIKPYRKQGQGSASLGSWKCLEKDRRDLHDD